MVLNISFKQIDSSDALKGFIEEKSETLKKYFDGQISVTWTLSIEKQNNIAHCHLVGNHMDYFGEASTQDFRASVEAALHRIETQVRKHKEIVKDHLHHQSPRTSRGSAVGG